MNRKCGFPSCNLVAFVVMVFRKRNPKPQRALRFTKENPKLLLYQRQLDEALLAGSVIDALHRFPVVLRLGPED
jgi:hypothetical protein